MKETVFKYFEGSATDKELKELLFWLRKKENQLVFSRFSSEWKNSLKPNSFPDGGKESFQKFQEILAQKSFMQWQKSRKIISFYRVAAIFFFIVASGTLILYFSRNFQSSQQITETFTNIIAENGQISKVKLPDGSTVWLNSGSELSFNNFFSIENRNLSLSGEAFFDVEKNENIPMIVKCNELNIKVLGTKFNVNAYEPEKNVNIALESGKIELFNEKTKLSYYEMKPGELAKIYIQTDKFTTEQVNIMRYTSWKDGIINIYNLSIEDLIVRLEKRYNQKFELSHEVKDLRYTFTIKNEPLENILKLMERITPVKINQTDETIKIDIDKNKLK